MARNVISHRLVDSVSAGVSAFRAAWGTSELEVPPRSPRTWPPSARPRAQTNASDNDAPGSRSDERATSEPARAMAGSLRPGDGDPTRTSTIHPGSAGLLTNEDVNPQRANNLRFALVEERLAVISERLELMSERLTLVGRRTRVESERASPKVLTNLSSQREGDIPPDMRELTLDVDDAFASDALRPPKVPKDLALIQTPAAASGIKTKTARRQVGPTLTGTVSGVSLGSLFNLFELERCGGVFMVRHDQQQLELTLRDGAVIRCRLNSARVSPVDGVRQAFLWPTCGFSFRRDDVDEESEQPQSVNTVMLEAMRHNDEAARVG